MKNEINLLIGSYLKNARKNKKMTQQQVADASGITLSKYREIERGRNSLFFEDPINISAALDFSLMHLSAFLDSKGK